MALRLRRSSLSGLVGGGVAETEMKIEISEDDFANAKRVNEGGNLASPTGFEPVLSA